MKLNCYNLGFQKTDEVNTQIRAVIVSKDEEIKEKTDALNALECAFSESKETWKNEKSILKDLLLEEQRVNSEIKVAVSRRSRHRCRISWHWRD